jgi:hypothetical protein
LAWTDSTGRSQIRGVEIGRRECHVCFGHPKLTPLASDHESTAHARDIAKQHVSVPEYEHFVVGLGTGDYVSPADGDESPPDHKTTCRSPDSCHHGRER